MRLKVMFSTQLSGCNCIPSVLAGILLGDESGISEKVDRAFRDTDTPHIIVISGFNITIIAGLLVGVFSRIFGGG